MAKNNMKVDLEKYISPEEKIKRSFIFSCTILIVLTFIIFVTYSFFINNTEEIIIGSAQSSVPYVEIIKTEKINNKQVIYTIKNNSNTNTYSYNLNYKETENCNEIYYKISDKEYSHAKGIIKLNEEKKIYVTSKSDCNINSLDLKLDSGYEYSPIKISNGYKELRYLSSKDDDNAIVDELREKYGIYVDEIQTSKPDFSKGYPFDYNDTSQSGLYKTQDDDGDSYYFRGDQTINNYVYFADQYWRILRINGDGTIRLITVNAVNQAQYNESIDEDKYLGYTYDNHNSCTNKNPCVSDYTYNSYKFTDDENIGLSSTIKNSLEDWYMRNLNQYDDYIALTKYCNDTSEYSIDDYGEYRYYNAYLRNSEKFEPSLKCPDPKKIDGNMQTFGGIYKLKIGLASADELVMAGIGDQVKYINYIQYEDSNDFWTMSPGYVFTMFGDDGYILPQNFISFYESGISPNDVNLFYVLRPVINLNSNTNFISGDGSYGNPYKLE